MHEIVRCPALALLLCAGAATAQTVPNPRLVTSTTPTAATASTSSSTKTTATRKVSTGEIFRWVDSNGKVQYSADVPEERKSTARKIDTRTNIVSSRVPASTGGPPQAAPSDVAPAARQPVTEREKCEAAWQRYNEAQTCFARYRQGTVGGAGKKSGSNVSPEALEKCQILTEPAACR